MVGFKYPFIEETWEAIFEIMSPYYKKILTKEISKPKEELVVFSEGSSSLL